MEASMVDIREVESKLGSYKFTVPTRQIIALKNQVEEWISLNSCGAIIYGNSRSGKTSAIGYVSESLKKTYGAQLPVYVYCATDHTHTDKTFYSSLLVALGHEMAHQGTAVQMRQRLVNRIIANAMDTKYHRAILFIDEAYLLTEKEYVWLIDIYNELHKSGVDLTVFLIGTKELKEQKEGFIRAGKQQIVLRFMVFEFKFKGIESKFDAEICLSSLDNSMDVIGIQELVNLSELYFPMAYHDGIKLASFAKDIWDAFEIIKRKYKIHSEEILMKHFVDTIFYCLKTYGAFGKKLYAPTVEEWTESIIKIGYVMSQI